MLKKVLPSTIAKIVAPKSITRFATQRTDQKTTKKRDFRFQEREQGTNR
jgi:hypothetical protein